MADTGIANTETTVSIAVKLLNAHARLPVRAYDHDAAFDLFAAESTILPPQSRAVVGTGIALGMPTGIAALTLPRSGLAARDGITLANAPGLIDAGYRGEIKLVLLNTDAERSFTVNMGDRIAQLLLLALPAVALHTVTELGATVRGERGFGSSGVGDGP
jgi:dUTP pyrophosphatase